MKFYMIIGDGCESMTQCVHRLPRNEEEQERFLGAELLLLCTECTLGTISEDKTRDYARRISHVIRMDMSPSYGLNLELFHLLWPTCSDKSYYLPELSYDDAIEQNSGAFLELLRKIYELKETWFRPYF